MMNTVQFPVGRERGEKTEVLSLGWLYAAVFMAGGLARTYFLGLTLSRAILTKMENSDNVQTKPKVSYYM